MTSLASKDGFETFEEFYPHKVRERIALDDWDNWVVKGYNASWLIKYYDTVTAHVAAVQRAGKLLGVNLHQLALHDDSKFTADEFPQYARHFHGDKGDPEAFARAWLHHLHANPHHWQHWIFPLGHAPRGVEAPEGVLRMPDQYVWEMVADWQGASLIYSGTTDLGPWLLKEASKVTLHRETAHYLTEVLSDMGYRAVFEQTAFRVPREP